MATDLEVRHLLIYCKDAGIDIKLAGDSIQAKGGKERTDLYRQLKEYKSDIVYALSHIPEVVETHYLSRLRAGHEWMSECLKRLKQDRTNERLLDALVDYMMKWSLLDEELRRIYPEYQGCPLEELGGCDLTYAPICMHCAENTDDT